MIELTVLCEGPSEVGFVDRVLKHHLASRDVYAKPIPLNRLNFGVVSWEKLRKGHSGSVGNAKRHQFTTSMIDLYALPNDYRDGVPLGNTKKEWVRNIEASMAARLPSPQWIPYIQLHEFEALLFVDLGCLSARVPGSNLETPLRRLREDVNGLRPEEIDEGRTTAPSKRILRHVPAYAKAQIGPESLADIGLARLRGGCPHFNEWVTKLEGLGHPL